MAQPKKEDKDEKKVGKQKVLCKNYKATDHLVKSCPKRAANKAGTAIAYATPSTPDSANVVQDLEWAFIVQYNFESSLWRFLHVCS